jgi:hypothetical protein
MVESLAYTALVTQSNSYNNILGLGTNFAKYPEDEREVTTASIF